MAWSISASHRAWPWPTSADTGVPAGTTLTAYTGPTNITTNGTVIDSKTISLTGSLSINADDVTIRKCRIIVTSSGVGPGSIIDNAGNNLLVEDTEMNGGSFDGQTTGIRFGNFKALRCDVYNVGEGFNVSDGAWVQDCYVHDLYGSGASHNNCLLTNGGTGITVIHNTFHAAYNSLSPATDSATWGISGALSLYGDFSVVSNVLIQNNWLAGGQYTTYGGSLPSKAFPNADHVQYINNRFGTDVSPLGGVFGPVASFDPEALGNAWQDNYWFDGASQGQEITP